MSIFFHYIYGLAIFFFSYIATKSILIYFKNNYVEKIIFFPVSVLIVIFFILTFFLFLKIWIIVFFILIINIFKNYKILFKDIKKQFLNYNFILINVLLIVYCLNNITIVHSASEIYKGWGLTDTMYGLSRTFSYPISFFEFKDLSLLDHKFPIAQSFFGILALPVNFLKIFDPYLYLSVSIHVYAFIYLYYFLQFYKKNRNINFKELILLSIFVICSLKFPIYFLENGWKAILIIPLAYSCAKILINSDNLSELKILSIIFLLVISTFLIKTGIIIVLGFLTAVIFFSFSRKGQLIMFSIGIILLLIFSISFSLERLFHYFYQPNSILVVSDYKIAKINLLITFFSLIILRFFSNIPTKIFIFLYLNLVFYFVFPTISVFNLFFSYLTILFYFFESNRDIFKKIKIKLINYFIGIFIAATIFGYLMQNEYFLIYLFFISFVYFSTVKINFQNLKMPLTVSLIFSLVVSISSLSKILGFSNMNYQYSLITNSHKDLALKVKQMVNKNDLIFTDLGKNVDSYHGIYGDAYALQLTQSTKQFYLLSFYTDLYNYYDDFERKKIINLNENILNGIIKPSEIKYESKFDNFYAILDKKKLPVPHNFKLEYSNENLSLYKIILK
jgi:hypothetical protein